MLDCNLDWLSSDAMTAHIVLVVRVDATGLLTVRATATYLFADPTPDDNTATVLANQPATPTPTPPAKPAAVLRPVIGRVTITPAPTAGKHVVVSFRVTRSDNHKPLTTGTLVAGASSLTLDCPSGGSVTSKHGYVCKPSGIKGVGRFANGVARLSFVIPKNGKGRVLTVKLTIKVTGQSATKIATFPVK